MDINARTEISVSQNKEPPPQIKQKSPNNPFFCTYPHQKLGLIFVFLAKLTHGSL